MLKSIKNYLFKDTIAQLESENTKLATELKEFNEQKAAYLLEKQQFESERSAALEQKKLCTTLGEPYLKISWEPLLHNGGFENLNNVDFVDKFNVAVFAGSYELDWNDKFVANLIRSGVKQHDLETDSDIVDRWFQQVSTVYVNMFNRSKQYPDNTLYSFTKDM